MIRVGMTTRNSFNTRTDIRVGGQTVQIYSLPALEKAGFSGVSRLPYSMKILLENLLRREDNAFVKADDIEALAALERQGERREGNLVHAGARAAAGLHRRAVRGGSRRDARRDGRARWQSGSHQPAAARRAGDRSLGPGRLLRPRRRLRPQRRARVHAQPRALCVSALGPARVPQLRGRAARHGHRPPGQHRAPRARDLLGDR